MSSPEIENPLTREELARELVSLFDELRVDQINEVLAKNVPFETLQFFSAHAEEFAKQQELDGRARQLLPNLLLMGYLLRVLEERLLGDGDVFDA